MILALYIAACAADIATTLYALRTGRGREGGALRFAGKFWLPIRIGLAVLIAVLWHLFDAPDWVLIVGTCLYAAVAVSNVIVARSAK